MRGANDRISLAVIGTGTMGSANLDAASDQIGVAISALCDVFQPFNPTSNAPWHVEKPTGVAVTPSLHGHYPASSLLRASPPPSGPLTVMDSRFALVPHRPGGLPRFLDRSLRTRRPQPPRRSDPVLADCFPDRAGFILV